MAYFNSKQVKYIPQPIPEDPGTYPVYPPTPPTPTPGSDPNVPRPTFSGNTNVVIGITDDDRISLNKTYSTVFTSNISIMDDCDLLSPRIIIDSNTDLKDCNYMYIFNRYYFLNVRRLMPGGNRYELIGKEDVLMTWKDQIKTHNAIIARSSNTYNKYLQDKSFKIYSYKNTRTLRFSGTGFTKNLNFVLTTVGGANT